jgi:enterochelin esterase family protein
MSKIRAVVASILLFPAAAGLVWAQSPEVHPDRTVTFRLTAPKAVEAAVSGEFMKGTKTMAKDEKGVWSVTIGPIEPEIYNYNFIIDGVRTIDPGNPNVKSGSTPSTIASILEVRADRPAFYDGQPVAHGDIHTHWYHSKATGTLRRLTVYTPPMYDATAQARYPVLYLFHGANADETAWTRLGQVNLILDNLLAARKAKPFLVVMPFGYGLPPGTPRTGGVTSEELFTRDLIEDVIPLVQSRYRASPDRAQRAIAGLSMGGGQALSIGLNHLELFSYVAGFSSGLRPAEFEKIYAAAAAKPKDVNQALRLLWIGCGTDDGAMANNRALTKFLAQHDIKYTFRESEGAHTWMVWRRYLNEIAPLLFQ